jgi:hypothetical protein
MCKLALDKYAENPYPWPKVFCLQRISTLVFDRYKSGVLRYGR